MFVQVFAPPPRMFVFDAIDFAVAVARVGKFLGYDVTVCDARGVFATRLRFPEVDEVMVNWPHHFLAVALEQGLLDRRAVLCVLTHDPKSDVPGWKWHCAPTPDTSARWARAVRTTIGCRGCGRRASAIGVATAGRRPGLGLS